MSNLFSNMVGAVMVLYAVEVLAMNPFLIGAMFALGSVGSLLAAVIAPRLSIFLRVGWLIVLSAAVFSLGGLLFLLATSPSSGVFMILGFFSWAAGGVVYNINQVSYRQALVPVRLQGRLNATIRFIVWGVMPVGSLTGGAIGQAFGLYPAIAVGVVGGAFSFLWVLFSPVRNVQSIPTSPEVGVVRERGNQTAEEMSR